MTLKTETAPRIFISIASYRDLQLGPTVEDCLRKAAHPERLRFGICWQHGAEELPLELFSDPNCRVFDIDWRESRGACWARAAIMDLWQGEEWFLQVDSHCRFAPRWDETLLRMAAECGSAKPILSTYATPFTPDANEQLTERPLQMLLQGFSPEGILTLKPGDFNVKPDRPVRARFVSAGFLFAPGSFVAEVPYNPELYFLGEETALTLRAFTHGYDFFHPPETVIWHDYIRADAKKHWGDHQAQTSAQPWSQLDEASRAKVRRLMLGEDTGRFGLGAARTLADYEAFSGINLQQQKAQTYTMRGDPPPNPETEPGWEERIYPWIARIVVEGNHLPPQALDDMVQWYIGIHDADGCEIYREDIPAAQIAPLRDQPVVTVICEFAAETIPVSWTIWPVHGSRGWLRKTTGRFGEDDFAILKPEDVSSTS
ncbi:GlcNAc-transferase family protein [Silvibacterium acidisoli]|uniref:GlcNAc-transferase family protein n=1 Tax=Acidobacteriaceae bacterium ZG23-2 TaxID=2883246 RepID=UPI00406D2E28